MADAYGQPIQIGDLVCRHRWDCEKVPIERHVGVVVGYAAGDAVVRVKSIDGRKRLWLARNIYNVDADCGEGNYAVPHLPHVTNQPRLGFVADHGSRDRPARKE